MVYICFAFIFAKIVHCCLPTNSAKQLICLNANLPTFGCLGGFVWQLYDFMH